MYIITILIINQIQKPKGRPRKNLTPKPDFINVFFVFIIY